MLQIKKLFKRKDAPVSVHDTTPPPPSILALAEKIAKKKCQSRTAQDMVPSHLYESLRIECPDPTAEDKLRDENQQLGQRLVRQENWKDLTQAIQNADAANTLTPGFISVAELIAYGARADVVLAAEHVISEIETGVAKELLNGIEEFEHILAENRDNYVIACIVAQTHIDMGWAWRGTAWAEEIPLRNLEAYNAHFDRAYDIIAPFIDRFPTSPLVVATHCAQVTGAGGKTHKIADQLILTRTIRAPCGLWAPIYCRDGSAATTSLSLKPVARRPVPNKSGGQVDIHGSSLTPSRTMMWRVPILICRFLSMVYAIS